MSKVCMLKTVVFVEHSLSTKCVYLRLMIVGTMCHRLVVQVVFYYTVTILIEASRMGL